MKLSKEASYLINRCYTNKNEPLAFEIIVGDKFTIGNNEDKKYKITNEIVKELESSGLIYVGTCGREKEKYMISGKKGGRPE